MTYKDNCKTEGEILTRLKIARHYFADNISQKEIAKDIGCHKNTINEIIRLCKNESGSEILTMLSSHEKIKTHNLKLFEFLRCESRAPKTNPRQADTTLVTTIAEKHSELHYGARRLYKHIQRSMVDTSTVTFAKVKGVFKRLKLVAKTIRTQNGERRKLYEYEQIGAFEYLQYDTKTIADGHALPADIYRKFKDGKLGLPKYQWTIVDAKTRVRFLAWSNELSAFYGFKFLQIVILWLRAHGIQSNITAREDGGSEFFSGSKRKLGEWNAELTPMGAQAEHTGGTKWKNNLVERTHRTDDEEFYCPRGDRINSLTDFMSEAQNWIFYWNDRQHGGIGMHGMSPKEKLYSLGVYNAEAICRFPLLLLDKLFTPLMETCPQERSQYVLTPYL
jgi:transposase